MLERSNTLRNQNLTKSMVLFKKLQETKFQHIRILVCQEKIIAAQFLSRIEKMPNVEKKQFTEVSEPHEIHDFLKRLQEKRSQHL